MGRNAGAFPDYATNVNMILVPPITRDLGSCKAETGRKLVRQDVESLSRNRDEEGGALMFRIIIKDATGHRLGKLRLLQLGRSAIG